MNTSRKGQLDSEFSNSINRIKKLVAVIGIRIYLKDESNSILKQALHIIHYVFSTIFLIINMLVLLGSLIAEETITFLGVTNVLPCVCYCIIGFVKLQALYVKRNKVEHLLNDLEELFPTNEENHEIIKMVQKYMRNVKFIILAIYISNVLFIGTWNLSPFLAITKEYMRSGVYLKLLPYSMYLPFDTTGNFGYIVGYLFHVSCGTFTPIAVIGSDGFFVTVGSHIVLQFKLLKNKMRENVGKTLPADLKKSLDINHNHHDKLFKKLVEYVHIHKQLIEFADTVENIFTVSILVNLIGSSVLICCVGFQATVMTGIEMFIFTCFLLTGLTQTLSLCWVGQQLIDESMAIGDAVYNSQWYLTDSKYRKMVFFIMLRSQRPQVFTALRFSIVCLRSFTAVMRTSYSYFTLINTTYKK